MKFRPVLLVEDDPATSYLFEHAFRRHGSRHPLVTVRTGEEAIAYFQERSEAAHPVLVILDLLLPDQSGLRVLRHLRTDLGLTRVPIVVLSVVRDARTVQEAYDCGANSYLTKPESPEAMQRILEVLDQYWLEMNVKSGNGM